MRFKLLSFIVAVLLFICFETYGQVKKLPELVQISGLVLTSDSLLGVPYASVIIKGTGRGTITNYQGFFSLVAAKGDTIQFSALGFADGEYGISKDVQETRFSIVELLPADTIFLEETVIFPWPTPEQFREAFLALDLPQDELEIAKRNLDQQRLNQIAANMPKDGNETADYYMRQEAYKYYYAGQAPPMNIFNPIAWAQFIKAWKNGDFKKADKR